MMTTLITTEILWTIFLLLFHLLHQKIKMPSVQHCILELTSLIMLKGIGDSMKEDNGTNNVCYRSCNIVSLIDKAI